MKSDYRPAVKPMDTQEFVDRLIAEVLSRPLPEGVEFKFSLNEPHGQGHRKLTVKAILPEIFVMRDVGILSADPESAAGRVLAEMGGILNDEADLFTGRDRSKEPIHCRECGAAYPLAKNFRSAV